MTMMIGSISRSLVTIHMDDPFAPKKPFGLKDYRVERMVLSPSHWNKFKLKHVFCWQSTRFDPANAGKIPANKMGVYSFVVRPEIAAHPHCAYLMYVGKAENQSLRKRFKNYFRELKDTSRRVHVSKMLRLWQQHLWFCYAPVANVKNIDAVEDALINAYQNISYFGWSAVLVAKSSNAARRFFANCPVKSGFFELMFCPRLSASSR
jgi:hypothetical protein